MTRRSPTLGPQERLLILKQLTLEMGFSADSLVPLAQHAAERVFASGAVAVTDGDIVDSVFVLARGRLALTRNAQELPPVLPGGVHGAVEVMADALSTTTAIATTETLVLEISAETLFDVLEDHFSLFIGTLRSLASALLAHEGRLVAIASAMPTFGSALATIDADSLTDRLRLLRRQPAFHPYRLESLARLAAELKTVVTEGGTRLWSRGDKATWVALVVWGEIRCSPADRPPFAQGAGAFVGGTETFAEGRRWFDADIVGSTTILRLEMERFVDLLEDDFGLARAVLGTVARGVLESRRGDDRIDSVPASTASR